MAQQQTNYTPLLIGGGMLLLWDKLFGKDKETKDVERETQKIEDAPINKNPFDYQNFKVAKKKGYVRSVVPAIDLMKAAKKIFNAIGVFTDDESEIMDGIKTAQTKADIAIMAMYYSKIYKRDMYNDFKKNLNSKEIGRINLFVNKLPSYIKGVKGKE